MCNDPFVTYLGKFGYAVVRLPKADLMPLQMLAESGGSLTRLGALTDVLIVRDNVPLPPLSLDNPAPNIAGQKSDELSIGVGIKILSGALAALGAGQIGLDAQYSQARSAQFTFTGVSEDRVDITKLDVFLGSCDLNPHALASTQLLESNEVYIVTATIKSRKFTIEAKDSKQASLTVNVPVIQQIVGGDVKVSASAAESSQVTYEGKIPLVFGFQAVRLNYGNGHYTTLELPADHTPPMKLNRKVAAGKSAEAQSTTPKPDKLQPKSRLYRIDS